MRIRLSIFLLLLAFFSLPASARHKKATDVTIDSNKAKTQTLTENDQRAFDYYFNEALSLKHQEKYAAAFDLFRYCIALDSLNAQAWYETAAFYINLKQPEQALVSMEKAFFLNKGNEWYALGLAGMYISHDKESDAIAIYEDLVKMKPEDENLLYQLAGLYAQTENDKAAIRTYEKVERLIGKNESVSFEKYKLYKTLNKPKKAIREIVTLCADYPYDMEYVLLLGDAWMDLGKPDKALLQYNAAKAMDSNNPAVALSFADYYNETGDTLAAQQQLILALTNPSTDVDMKLNIFSPILATSMQTADSVKIPKYFEILLEQHPNDPKIRDLHVQWLLKSGQKQEAKNELRTVLDLNPNQLQSWKMYLELNAEADNQQQLRQICTEALTYFPKEPIFWFYQGLSWISDPVSEVDSTNHLNAIDFFQKAVAVAKPEDAVFLSRLYGLIGDSYNALSKKTLAFEYYDKALAAFPGNILVLNNYAYYLCEDGGDLAKAERMSRKTIEAEPKNPTYLDTFAWIFFKEGKYGLAKIYIERAVANELDPSSVILEHYGDILWFNGEQDAALVQWNKALKLQNPSEILFQKVETGKYVNP
ncbi:MAG: tetratricopeptide repeat protein [Bacteroidales bacterium]|nr:tetratricopeptide repeat protein [Bacteroidales bacterium]